MAKRKMTRGERNIFWIESVCRIPDGRLVGQPVRLTSAQKGWIKQLYDSPTRTFILSMARKNAKTATSSTASVRPRGESQQPALQRSAVARPGGHLVWLCIQGCTHVP